MLHKTPDERRRPPSTRPRWPVRKSEPAMRFASSMRSPVHDAGSRRRPDPRRSPVARRSQRARVGRLRKLCEHTRPTPSNARATVARKSPPSMRSPSSMRSPDRLPHRRDGGLPDAVAHAVAYSCPRRRDAVLSPSSSRSAVTTGRLPTPVRDAALSPVSTTSTRRVVSPCQNPLKMCI